MLKFGRNLLVLLMFILLSFSVEAGMKIVIVSGNEKYNGEVYDTAAGKSFWNMLPLELKMEDYNKTEKISYLNNKLNTSGMADSFTPKKGDIGYYAPWGNICFFYKDFRLSHGLYSVGRVIDGIEKLGSKNEDFTIRIEKAE